MDDCLIIGGGVIGLSLAYELAGHGSRVRVIDAGQPGMESSWAGVGIFPPPAAKPDNPYDELIQLSSRLYYSWSKALLAETGIDNEYRSCGALFLARSDEAIADLDKRVAEWQTKDISFTSLSLEQLAEMEPHLRPRGKLLAAYFLHDELQVRTSRHLKALVAACEKRGVKIMSDVTADDFVVNGKRVTAVQTSQGALKADQFCLATGAWSTAIGQKLGLKLAVKPMRGQIVCLAAKKPLLSRILYEEDRYIVPRADGRMLVGSTVEDAGFDRRVTSDIVAWLLDFAHDVVPELREAEFETIWAGLRPMSLDGKPYIGRSHRLENVLVSVGHFRAGLHLAPANAVVLSEMIRGKRPRIDLTPFAVDRA